MEGGIAGTRDVAYFSQAMIQYHKPNYVKEYYRDIFLYDDIYRWLTYADEYQEGQKPIESANREISLHVQTSPDFSFYKRYQFFKTAEEFKQKVVESSQLARLDVGAVYKKSSQTKMDRARTVDWREFVIDIDLDLYDQIRTCCRGKTCCKLCWKLVEVAQKVVIETLKKDFGFTKILWLFSGQRGVHAWVCDLRARIMDAMVRKSIISYLTLAKYNHKSRRLTYSKVRENFEVLLLMISNSHLLKS